MMTLLFQFLIQFPGIAVTGILVPLIALRWFILPADRQRTEWLLVASVLIQPAAAFAEFFARNLSRICPRKYDLYGYRFDSFFGQPSFHLGQLVWAHSWSKILVSTSYGLLPTAVLATFAAYLWLRPQHEIRSLVKAFVLNLFIAVIFYVLIPVCGPAFAFPHFPELPQGTITLHAMAIDAAPNGIPSVHMSTAILVAWFLRRWRWGLIVGGLFSALTVIATLGSGQHYLLDLFCAVPYSIGILLATNQERDALEVRKGSAGVYRDEELAWQEGLRDEADVDVSNIHGR